MTVPTHSAFRLGPSGLAVLKYLSSAVLWGSDGIMLERKAIRKIAYVFELSKMPAAGRKIYSRIALEPGLIMVLIVAEFKVFEMMSERSPSERSAVDWAEI